MEKTMKELTLLDQKEIAFRILSELDDICEQNGFTYSLAYGTLLGAVRHQGFIPWDDDIDIMMPRKDYLNFIEYCKTHETPFELASVETDPAYGYLFAKACDPHTVLVPGNVRWQKYGVQVDIFPIEHLGSNRTEAKQNADKRRFQRELLVATNWKGFLWNERRSFLFNCVKFLFFLMGRFASPSALAASIKNFYEPLQKEDCEYVGIVCGAYRDREIMHRSIYEQYIDIPFESGVFKAIAKYDEYLRLIYGDYMQLPPEKDRVPQHNFKVYKQD